MANPQRNPDRISREVLVENPWHRYCLDRYRLKNGDEGRYFYIEMFGSAGVIPIFPDGSTLLLRVKRYLLNRVLWEWPIGGIEVSQSPAEAAAKELHEEAGLLAERLIPLGSFAPYKGASTEECHFFLAEGLSEGRQSLEETEEISCHRMPFAEARERLMEQPIGDGQSLVGLLYLERYWAQQGITDSQRV